MNLQVLTISRELSWVALIPRRTVLLIITSGCVDAATMWEFPKTGEPNIVPPNTVPPIFGNSYVEVTQARIEALGLFRGFFFQGFLKA